MVAEPTDPKVVVYSHNGRWRWIYEEDSMRLASNDEFESPTAALHSAAVAYPDVADVEVVRSEGAAETQGAEVRHLIRADLRRGALVLAVFLVLFYLVRRRSRSVAGHG